MKDPVREGKLELILEQYWTSSDGFYLYYPSKSQVQPKLRAFIEHVKSSTKEFFAQ